MIAGLETVTDGAITIDGRDVTGLHPSDRSIAMVFQDYGLYRTMSVRENMAYGLKHSTSLSRDERTAKVEEMARMFDIGDLLDRDVTSLSGGQKQRVALGRAMVREPDVFLLDEPLASLDAKLRSEMRTELQQLQSELDITTVYVTHDQKEAMTMADKVAVLHDGRLRQFGHPERVYDAPVDGFVADFLGNPAMNQLRTAVVRDGDWLGLAVTDGTDSRASDGRATGRLGPVIARVPPEAVSEAVEVGDVVQMGVRPEALRVGEAPAAWADVDATVVVTEYQGSDNFLHLAVEDHDLTAVVPPSVAPDAGESVRVAVPPSAVHVFDVDTGAALSVREGDGPA
jgi:multiple sugar transport system ATP-binding protein